jgi:hypothetical protein
VCLADRIRNVKRILMIRVFINGLNVKMTNAQECMQSYAPRLLIQYRIFPDIVIIILAIVFDFRAKRPI